MADEVDIAVELLASSMPRYEYLRVLDFPDLRGKRVLDIGSGSCDVVMYLNSLGAEAYGTDVRYIDLESLKIQADAVIEAWDGQHHGAESREYLCAMKNSYTNFLKDFTKGRNYVCALAGSLPFPNGIFDFVYSSNCITHGLDRNYAIFDRAVHEALRVLKRGGEFRSYPFMGEMEKKLKKNQKKLMEKLGKEGFDARSEKAIRFFDRFHVAKP